MNHRNVVVAIPIHIESKNFKIKNRLNMFFSQIILIFLDYNLNMFCSFVFFNSKLTETDRVYIWEPSPCYIQYNIVSEGQA